MVLNHRVVYIWGGLNLRWLKPAPASKMWKVFLESLSGFLYARDICLSCLTLGTINGPWNWVNISMIQTVEQKNIQSSDFTYFFPRGWISRDFSTSNYSVKWTLQFVSIPGKSSYENWHGPILHEYSNRCDKTEGLSERGTGGREQRMHRYRKKREDPHAILPQAKEEPRRLNQLKTNYSVLYI